MRCPAFLLVIFLLAVPAPAARAQSRHDVQITSGTDAILVSLPLTGVTGRVRPKQQTPHGPAQAVAPLQTVLGADCYLEWQIGYDTTDHNAPGRAPGVVFERDGRTKYGHELSLLLFEAKRLGLLPVSALRALRTTLESAADGLEETCDVSVEKVAPPAGPLRDGFAWLVEKTPLLVKDTPHGRIEIRLRPKQRAVGDQAMLYVCLPMPLLLRKDGTPRPPAPATSGERVLWKVTRENAGFLLEIVRGFGAASRQHNADMRAILDDLLDA